MSQTDSTQTSGKKVKKSLIGPLKELSQQLTKNYRFYIPNPDGMYTIEIDLDSKTELTEAMKQALEKASKVHPVDKNPLNYEAYVSKKNGNPKMDFPSYQTALKLEETSNNVFSLVHITFEERAPKRKSTYDLSHYQTPIAGNKPQRLMTVKQERGCLFRFFGCS